MHVVKTLVIFSLNIYHPIFAKFFFNEALADSQNKQSRIQHCQLKFKKKFIFISICTGLLISRTWITPHFKSSTLPKCVIPLWTQNDKYSGFFIEMLLPPNLSLLKNKTSHQYTSTQDAIKYVLYTFLTYKL